MLKRAVSALKHLDRGILHGLPVEILRAANGAALKMTACCQVCASDKIVVRK
jgi:hypothetical protein